MENGTRTASHLREGVAEEVRALLARKRLSGAKLAQTIGRSEMYVSRRLRGETAFDLDDLERIAAALGAPIGALLPRSVLSEIGVTVLEPQVTKRVTRTTQTRTAHRPNGRPVAGVAPGNRRTTRTTRSGPAKRA